MTTLPTDSPRWRRRMEWAQDRLEAPTDVSENQLKSRFFACLEDEDFVPDEALAPAFRVLQSAVRGSTDGEDPKPFRREQEEKLQDDIEAFAREMLKIAVPQRREQWRELVERAEGAAKLQNRLQRLRLGLDVDLAEVDKSDEAAVELAWRAAELFPLRPLARAVRRHRILQSWDAEPKKWEVAARRFSQRYPELAQLAPELISRLSQHSQETRQKKQVKKRQKRQQATPHQVFQQQPASANASSAWRILLPLVAILVGVAIAVLSRGRSSSKPSYAPPSSTFEIPKISTPPFRPGDLTPQNLHEPPAPFRSHTYVEESPEERARRMLQELQDQRKKLRQPPSLEDYYQRFPSGRPGGNSSLTPELEKHIREQSAPPPYSPRIP